MVRLLILSRSRIPDIMCGSKYGGKEGDHTVSAPAFFETGKMDDPWRAEFISTKEEDKFHPIFIKNFSRPSGIKRACIYLTGLGLYEAYLNGEKIGDDFLAPFINDYRTRVQYQTYDITELLEDDNRIEILCGNGFYKGRFGYEGDVEYFGNRFGIIAEIHMWDKAGHDILLGKYIIHGSIEEVKLQSQTFMMVRSLTVCYGVKGK